MDKKTGIVKREIEDRRDPMAMAGWGVGWEGGGASFPKTRLEFLPFASAVGLAAVYLGVLVRACS